MGNVLWGITEFRVNFLYLYTPNTVRYIAFEHGDLSLFEINAIEIWHHYHIVLQSKNYVCCKVCEIRPDPQANNSHTVFGGSFSAHRTALWHDYQVINAIIHYVYRPLGLNSLHRTRVLSLPWSIWCCLLRLWVFTLRFDGKLSCIQNDYIREQAVWQTQSMTEIHTLLYRITHGI